MRKVIKQGLALVAINTKVGKRKDGGEGWKREAYMNSVFKVANVTYSPAEGLRLNFVGSTSAALI